MPIFSDIAPLLGEQAIELPSWAFGNSGTRFKVFSQPGVARNPFEKIEDAAQVHKWTGLAPSIALHIPWDKVDDYAALRRHAEDHGIRLGTINSNTFQDDDYKLGSLTHSTDVRKDLADWRETRGLPRDPRTAFEATGYSAKIAHERLGAQAGWGA